ncbi:MAG: hypothetical protein HY321_05380 [Armatimonadetes bacterium]|nr:hypothetical protein [Armatimonadota bacterium]
MKTLLVVPAAIAVASIAASPASAPAEKSSLADLVCFRAAFDGHARAEAGGRPCAPLAPQNLSFEPADSSPALVVGQGTQVEYDLADFPHRAGALEIRLKPRFPQTDDQPERVILNLSGENGGSLSLSYVPAGTRWEFIIRSASGEWPLRSWYGRVKADEWNHLLLVWDQDRDPHAAVTLYLDGKAEEERSYDGGLQGIRRVQIGGAHNAEVSIDEMVLYGFAPSPSQVEMMARSFEAKADRFSALAERVAQDRREAEAARAARAALVARLKGRVGRLSQLRAEKPRNFAFPEGITARGIRPEDVGTLDLSRFAVIYFPPGGGFQLTQEQEQIIRDYVRNGGGYVGSCAGALFAHRLGLLECDRYGWVGNGALLKIELTPHPVTDGYGSSTLMHYGGGPLMLPHANAKHCHAIGVLTTAHPVKHAAIVAATYGKGRVVTFGPHPEGGGVSGGGKSALFSGKSLGTERLQVNALLWAAKLTGEAEDTGEKE